MELRRDVAPEQPVEEVEEPPYRLVPGNDSVLRGNVLSRFKRSMRIQPSKSQQRKKCSWERGTVSGHHVSGVLENHGDTKLVNAEGSGGALKMSENSGHHITYVRRIQEVHVRWTGNRDIEQQRLEQWTDILRKVGYTVVRADENTVDWPPGHSRTFILNRRNRQFLRVAKFHRQQRQRK